jgi:aldehyde:ferredoxin oxidoreductase
MAKKSKAVQGNSYWGKILNVNLSNGKIEFEQIGDDIYRDYLGGIGLAAKILWDKIPPGIDPMGPKNVLGLLPGLLTDTGSLFTGRFMAVGKSPQTGGWGDANCGGYFSPFLKRCEIDGLFFSGASKEPVYLYIDNEKAEILDASELWGLDAIETEIKLKEKHGRSVQVACIGVSGEKKSYMAGICNDGGRVAARSGLGGVMGSKKLKAVVAAGKTRVSVKNKAEIKRLSREFRTNLDKFKKASAFLNDRILVGTGILTRINPIYPRMPADLWRLLLGKFGTPALTQMSAEMGDSPVKNWGGVGCTDFDRKKSKPLSAETVISFETKKYGCYSCPLRCGGMMKVGSGKYQFDETHKPEYETICAFGTLLLNNDLNSIFKINDMANRAGIDTISCGGVVAFAIECFERGILTIKDTAGLQLSWGDSESIIELTRRIIEREGVGDLLADGVKVAAKKIGHGADKYAVHCGGVEAPMHDPKFDPGLGISYYCEPTPGRHTISSLQYLELQNLEKKFSRAKKIPFVSTKAQKYRYDDKGEAIAVDSFFKMLVDCAGACFFGTQVGGDIPLCEWMNAATGWNLTHDEYLQIGERVEQLRHCFNVREGLNPIRDFVPHPRIYGDPPLPVGVARGKTLDIDTLARSFYQAMNWSVKTGKPQKKYLKKLGLGFVADKLA